MIANTSRTFDAMALGHESGEATDTSDSIHAAFPALEQENRPAIETAAAAHYLLRRPQTLRIWACHENGPIRPIRINGRLAWPVADIRRIVLGGGK